MDEFYKRDFPSLTGVAQKKTSECNDLYNCIAWAFRDSQRHWWPNGRRSYWPINSGGMTLMEAFEAWFVYDGWEETTDVKFEHDTDKIALFALNGVPTHASRLISDGIWTSKLGRNIDLWHYTNDLGRVDELYQAKASGETDD